MSGRPVIGYAPGTQGMADRCAPSRLFSELIEYEAMDLAKPGEGARAMADGPGLLGLQADQEAGAVHEMDDGGDLRRFVNVYLDGEDIRYGDGLSTPVAERQELQILPAVAGGR